LASPQRRPKQRQHCEEPEWRAALGILKERTEGNHPDDACHRQQQDPLCQSGAIERRPTMRCPQQDHRRDHKRTGEVAERPG
jgi:hypothetical protein